MNVNVRIKVCKVFNSVLTTKATGPASAAIYGRGREEGG